MRNILVVLLAIVTLFSTGGIHLIFHHCLSTGEAQVHFTQLHGCCDEGDDHCALGGNTSHCCHSTHHQHEKSIQGECCTDAIHFFKTDDTDRFAPITTPTINSIDVETNSLLNTIGYSNTIAFWWLPPILSHPPNSPTAVSLCTFRT